MTKEQEKKLEAFDIIDELKVFPVCVSAGWTVWCTTPHAWPACLFGVALTNDRFNPGKWPGPWPDPATALIEARKWYKANVQTL